MHGKTYSRGKIEMWHDEKEKVEKALLSAFPSEKSFLDFKQKDREYSQDAIKKFIKEAKEKNIIKEATEEKFLEFIRKNTRYIKIGTLKGKSFAYVLEKILGCSKDRRSVKWLVSLLNKEAERFGLFPEGKICDSMITRLKQKFNLSTTKQRCVLRILAYWIGKQKLTTEFNYEQLVNLSQSKEKETEDGIVICVKIFSKGDVFSRDAVKWLKDEILECVEDLSIEIPRQDVKINSAISVCLNLPKERGPEEEPRLYSKSIRDSLALAHQISVRWFFSKYSTPRRAIITGIYAGRFNKVDIFLNSFLESHFYKDSTILLTDYARLCAKLADVKIIFKKSPESFNLGMGYVVNIWEVKYFWVYSYYDIIPVLMENKVLPRTNKSYNKFKQELYFPEKVSETTFEALSKIYQFPQNPSLLIEIAKVCLFRRMFHEADAILSKIFTFDPYHVIARIMRMIIYFNIALDQSDFYAAELAFDRAIKEGIFITSYPDAAEHEEVWSEFGLVHYARAIRYLSLVKKGKKEDIEEVIKQDIKEKIMSCLSKARESFLQGLMVSPSGKDNRCLFWLSYTDALMELLHKEDEDIENLFSKDNQGICDTDNVFKKVGKCFFSVLGLLEDIESIDEDSKIETLVELLRSLIKAYENSVLARNYIPNIKYAFCCLIWDFVPKLTVGLCNQILRWLEEAKTEAKELIEQNISVYSIATCFVQLQPPEDFVECINRTIEIIEKIIPNDILQQSNQNIFLNDDLQKQISKVKLMFLHIDKEVKKDVLFNVVNED